MGFLLTKQFQSCVHTKVKHGHICDSSTSLHDFPTTILYILRSWPNQKTAIRFSAILIAFDFSASRRHSVVVSQHSALRRCHFHLYRRVTEVLPGLQQRLAAPSLWAAMQTSMAAPSLVFPWAFESSSRVILFRCARRRTFAIGGVLYQTRSSLYLVSLGNVTAECVQNVQPNS